MVKFRGYTLDGVTLKPGDIATRQLRVAVPQSTNAAQWMQVERAIQYGVKNNVQVIVNLAR